MIETRQKQHPRPWVTATLTAIYTLAAVYLLLAWLGWQSLSPEWHRKSLPLYVLFWALGAVSGLAVLRWRRWGVYGMIGAWIATAILNQVFYQPSSLIASVTAALLAIMFALEIRRIWQFLT